MDLAWPSRLTTAPGDRYMTRNGTPVDIGFLTSCLNQPVPPNVTRARFPVQNGRVVFNLVNKTDTNSGSGGFSIDFYMPHLWYKNLKPTHYNTGVQNTYKSRFNLQRWSGFKNFVNDKKCYIPLSMTDYIVDKDGKALSASDLVGLNVTLNFQIVDGRNYRAFEQVDEVCIVSTSCSEETKLKRPVRIPYIDRG